MNSIGFSGKSGSGKSFIAAELCGKYGIEALIDDGLLIRQGFILSGISAKKQPNAMKAVKTALFTDDEHCKNVKKAIKDAKLENLMIIGTSDRMVDKICLRLELSLPEHYIHIEDVSSPEQIEKAHKARDEGGTHIIPALTMEVKKQFSGYFLDPKKGFRKDKEGKAQNLEKTLVRPTYSYLGKFEISTKVMEDIADILGKKYPFIADILWTLFDNSEQGMYIRLILQVIPGFPLFEEAKKLQNELYDTVSTMTAFNILGIEVELREFRS